MQVTKEIAFSEFEPDKSKYAKITDLINKNIDLKTFLRDDLDARIIVMLDRVQYTAPTRNVEEARSIIKAFLEQVVEEIAPEEFEITQQNKIDFIRLHEINIRVLCSNRNVELKFVNGS